MKRRLSDKSKFRKGDNHFFFAAFFFANAFASASSRASSSYALRNAISFLNRFNSTSTLSKNSRSSFKWAAFYASVSSSLTFWVTWSSSTAQSGVGNGGSFFFFFGFSFLSFFKGFPFLSKGSGSGYSLWGYASNML